VPVFDRICLNQSSILSGSTVIAMDCQKKAQRKFRERQVALIIMSSMVIICLVSGNLYPENPATPSSPFSDDPAINKAAAAFQKEVIIPFGQLWEKGQSEI
jgi:hypothetical protein